MNMKLAQALVLFPFLIAQLAAAQEPSRPNVLWICADDHAPYVMGAYGNRQVRTPNLDRLAAQGVRFDRAYCNSPVCTASRQSFLTGRYPRTIGVTQLRTALPEREVTLAEILREAGYATASFGKMHFNSNLKHGFDLRRDQPEYQSWLKRKGRAPIAAEIEVQPPWRPFKDPANVWLNSACRPLGLADADMYGTYLAHEASEFLRAPQRKPFFLMVSFTEPHSPFHFPIEFRNRHRADAFKALQSGPEDDWQIPKIFRDLSDHEKQGIIAAYHTSVEFLDRNFGLVLDALEKSGHAPNTLVIYTGDHGYMLGQHGRFEKHCGYEPAVRAPLLVRFDGHLKPSQSAAALVEFIDLVPTILEFAGVAVPPGVQGKSLTPVLLGKTRRHRDQVFIEYSENEEAYLVTERWKFIYGTGQRVREDGYAAENPQPGRTVQLFDLQSDPDELINLSKKPEHARHVEQFTRQLAGHMKRTARQPELLPKSDDPHTILDFCLQPRDVGAEPQTSQ
jgi:choline-sulfatase